jgi:hypothetical protein
MSSGRAGGNSDGKTSTDGSKPQGGSRGSGEKTDDNSSDGQTK